MLFCSFDLVFSSCVENYNPNRGLWAIHSSKARSPLTPPSMRSFHQTQAGYHFYKADFFNRRSKDSSNFSQGDVISEDNVIYPFAKRNRYQGPILIIIPEVSSNFNQSSKVGKKM